MMLTTLLVAASLHAAPTLGDVTIRWRGENYEPATLPEELEPAPRTAIESWAEWAARMSYRMDLSEDGRVLLVSSAGNRKRGKQMKLVEKTIAFFDEHLN